MREQRKRSPLEVVATGGRVVAGGSLVGIGVILFLRRVREPGFRWRALARPLAWVTVIAAAGLANSWPALIRMYDTERPMGLFRLGLIVSLVLSLAGLVLVASVALVLLSAARPGWSAALRRRGRLADAIARAALSAAVLLGVSRWFHVISARVPALYDPDPTLPSSLVNAIPAVDVVWSAARGAFGLAALAAGVVLAWNSAFFRSTAGRVLGLLAFVIVLAPSELRSPTEFGFEFATGVAAAAALAFCAFGLLRDHAAAWVLFGLFTFGGRGAIDLLGQPAAADKGSGWLAVLLLALFAVAVLAGRRDQGGAAAAPAALPPSL